MPTYVYKCPSCGKQIELIQKISEKAEPQCPDVECGAKMETVIVPTTFVLKGSCWAKDGYKK